MVSTLYQKNNVWQKKDSTFRLQTMKNNKLHKTLAEKSYDLAQSVGKDGDFKLDMGKGFILELAINIEPVDDQTHDDLVNKDQAMGTQPLNSDQNS